MIDWYPPASRQQTYPASDGRAYASGYAWKLVLHSTEGTSWPSYDNTAPHFTINPRTGDVRQHYPLSYPAKALYQPDSPSTNKGRAAQIEIIGTCDPSRKGNSNWAGWYLPDFAPADFKGLPDLLAWIAAQTGLSLSRSVDFRAYPSSYGAPTGRLSSSAWKAYNEVCGHQHVPSNNHGDPGNIDIDGLLALARGEDDDMPLSQDDINKIAKAVWDQGIADVDDVVRAARIVLKYSRTDTQALRTDGPDQTAGAVWNYELMEDPLASMQPAQRIIRHTRSDTAVIRGDSSGAPPGQQNLGQ